MPEARTLDIPHSLLNLDYTLPSGQAFRWRKSPDGWWTGVVGDSVVRIRAITEGFEWKTYPPFDDPSLLRDYFRLDDDVESVYARISAADEHVSGLIGRFAGLRLLRQDPTETLLSFVCSAANSIPRISAAIEALSLRYGKRIASLDCRDCHAFPSAQALADAAESDLQSAAGLGFRGLALKNVARQLVERPPGWLLSLRTLPYERAAEELLTIRGVGRKIADCVCLFALDKDEAVPVDTHVRQLATRLYLPDVKTRTVTPALYDRIGALFREKFGRYAGWAQQFLYYEDLLRGRHALGD